MVKTARNTRMATHRRNALLAALLAVPVLAGPAAAGLCEEGRAQSGLALAPGAEGLAVAVVDADSAGAEAGVHVGDVIVQVNETVPRSCKEYARAVREARRDHKALLILVRRVAGEVPLALAAWTWERPVAVAPRGDAPTVRSVVAAPPPPPLPPETHVTLKEVTRDLTELAPAEHPPARLDAYRRELLQLHRQTETLAARQAVPDTVVTGLRTVLRYYDAAAVAWDADETRRERERQPRHLPPNAAATAPYFTDSQAAAVIEEFPFLRAAVVSDPAPGVLGGESAGLWRPREARDLLLEHGRQELARLSAWVAGDVRE